MTRQRLPAEVTSISPFDLHIGARLRMKAHSTQLCKLMRMKGPL
jgi:hypothetical protein